MSPKDELVLRTQPEAFGSGYEFLLAAPDRSAVVTSLVIEANSDPEAAVVNPSFRLSKAAVQRLIDDLWNSGLRPSDEVGSAAHVAALDRHLSREMELNDRLLDQLLPIAERHELRSP